MDETIVKNGEVEVASEDEEGFKRAWYRAILDENPKSSCEKLRVRYLTLLNEDGSAPLTETVDRRLIRPVAPEDPYDFFFLGEGSVVDVDLQGGWWVGLVIKKIEDDESQKYLVYLDSPPDIIQFERRQLKAHRDWTGSKWIRPENKKLVKSVFSSGTMVEVKEDFCWREVMIVKELENDKRFIVKKCDNNNSLSCTEEESENEIVDSLRVRPMQPHFSIKNYELLDRVEAFSGFVWRQGMVRAIRCDGYMIRFVETKEEELFNRSDLRPLMEWKDGVWHKRVKRESEEETPSNGKRIKSVASEMATDDDDVIATPEKQEKGQKKIHEPMKNQNGLGNESIREKQREEDNSNKRETKAEVLPFTKKSPLWKICESMEVFKRLPQTPHFSPLIETKEEDLRELSALNMMANFSLFLEKLKELKSDVPISQLESLKDSFFELERHGFDITAPLSRIEKLLDVKNRQLSLSEEQKGLEKEIMDESSKIRKVEKEFHKTKVEILQLEWQQVLRKKQMQVAYEKISQKESCARDVGVKRKDVDSEFETTLSAPW